jgi:ribonuclease HI
MFLIQFDACNRDTLGISSIGYVLYYDSIVLHKHYSILRDKEYKEDSNEAEYKALISALNFALKFNIKYLNVEGDAKTIIDQVNNICNANSNKIKSLLNTVNNMKNKFSCINFEHIYRKNNTFADSLANQALYNYFNEN